MYPNRNPKCLTILKENIGIWDAGWSKLFFILDLQGNLVDLEEETKIKQVRYDSGVCLTLLSFPSVYVLLGDLIPNQFHFTSFPVSHLVSDPFSRQETCAIVTGANQSHLTSSFPVSHPVSHPFSRQQTCAIVTVNRYKEISSSKKRHSFYDPLHFYENEILRFSFPVSVSRRSGGHVVSVTESGEVKVDCPLTENGRVKILRDMRSLHQGYTKTYQSHHLDLGYSSIQKNLESEGWSIFQSEWPKEIWTWPKKEWVGFQIAEFSTLMAWDSLGNDGNGGFYLRNGPDVLLSLDVSKKAIFSLHRKTDLCGKISRYEVFREISLSLGSSLFPKKKRKCLSWLF